MNAEINYGQQIREVRKAFGFTQEEFSRKAGIAINSLRRYESNERQPTLDVVGRIAAAVGLSISDFMWYDTGKKRSYYWWFSLEEKLKQVGYSIGYSEEDAFLWINYPDGTLEVTEEDLKLVNDNLDTYLRFLLDDLRERHKKDFRPSRPEGGRK